MKMQRSPSNSEENAKCFPIGNDSPNKSDKCRNSQPPVPNDIESQNSNRYSADNSDPAMPMIIHIRKKSIENTKIEKVRDHHD